MNSRDLFKLAVRILGLAFVYQGLTALPHVVPAIYTQLIGVHFVGLLITLLMAIWPFAVAYWLLRGAPLIMRIAFPGPTETSQPETGAVCEHKVDA